MIFMKKRGDLVQTGAVCPSEQIELQLAGEEMNRSTEFSELGWPSRLRRNTRNKVNPVNLLGNLSFYFCFNSL